MLTEQEIKEKISKLEKELFEYQQKRQQELDDFMWKTGITSYISETTRNISYIRGKLDSLQDLLLKEKSEVQETLEVKDLK